MKTKTKTNQKRFKRTKCNNKHTNRRRNTNRVRKYNKHQTKTQSRRQFGGAFKSFITADDNIANKRKGIDVKVEVDSTGNPVWWLIGGNKWYDPTFAELKSGAKEGRYKAFIESIESIKRLGETKIEFTDPSSQKGIKLSHAQFCNMFINNPVTELTYPVLMQRFADRRYKCPESASSSVPMPASTATAPRPATATATATATTVPSDAAVAQIRDIGFTDLIAIRKALIQSKGDINAAIGFLVEHPPSSSAAMGGVAVTTPPITEPKQPKYIDQFNKIKNLKLKDVTLKAIAQALDSTGGNVDEAVAILLSAAAAPSAPSAPSASSAQLLSPESPEQIKRAYDATPVDLKNPNMFVENYVRTNDIRLLPKPSYRLDCRNLNAFPGFDSWQVVQTVGDGNCLTHAFLQCLSPTYGRMQSMFGYNNKFNVANEFRKKFSEKSRLARNTNLYNSGNCTEHLTDLEILDYSRLFNVITVVFEEVNANPSQQDMKYPIIAHNFLRDSSKLTDTVIFIHGDGGHYSSVMPSTGRFTMTLDEAKKITGLQRSLS
jgi:hypothetical protein